jgi:hypothetical protein
MPPSHNFPNSTTLLKIDKLLITIMTSPGNNNYIEELSDPLVLIRRLRRTKRRLLLQYLENETQEASAFALPRVEEPQDTMTDESLSHFETQVVSPH